MYVCFFFLHIRSLALVWKHIHIARVQHAKKVSSAVRSYISLPSSFFLTKEKGLQFNDVIVGWFECPPVKVLLFPTVMVLLQAALWHCLARLQENDEEEEKLWSQWRVQTRVIWQERKTLPIVVHLLTFDISWPSVLICSNSLLYAIMISLSSINVAIFLTNIRTIQMKDIKRNGFFETMNMRISFTQAKLLMKLVWKRIKIFVLYQQSHNIQYIELL